MKSIECSHAKDSFNSENGTFLSGKCLLQSMMDFFFFVRFNFFDEMTKKYFLSDKKLSRKSKICRYIRQIPIKKLLRTKDDLRLNEYQIGRSQYES